MELLSKIPVWVYILIALVILFFIKKFIEKKTIKEVKLPPITAITRVEFDKNNGTYSENKKYRVCGQDYDDVEKAKIEGVKCATRMSMNPTNNIKNGN